MRIIKKMDKNNRDKEIEKELAGSAVRSFQPFFSEKVMHQIEAMSIRQKSQYVFYETLVRMLRPAAAISGVLLIGLIVFHTVKYNHLSIESILAYNEVTLEDIFVPTFTAFE